MSQAVDSIVSLFLMLVFELEESFWIWKYVDCSCEIVIKYVEKSNIAGLTSIFWKPHLQDGSFAVNLDFKRVPSTLTDKNCSLWLSYLYNVVCVEYLLFFWESRILIHVKQKIPT